MTARTILLVEDNPASRKMMRVALEAEGLPVFEAADGSSALAYLESNEPALVIQDLLLPDIDGLDLTRRMRALPNGATVPILIASGFVRRLSEVQAARDQYAEVLVKPVTPAKLVEAVRSHLSRSARGPEPRLGRGRRVLLVDDREGQRKLDTLRLQEAQFEVVGAASAEDALALLAEGGFDVVVSDVVMPSIDGFELCSRVRHAAGTARVPVVLVSAHQTANDVADATRVGASAFVPRGLSAHDLIDAIAKAIGAGPPPLAIDEPRIARSEQVPQLVRRIERYAESQAALERQCGVQTAQLALLAGVADALVHSADMHATLDDVFAASLDAAGISKGAMYIAAPDGALVLRHAIGFDGGSAGEFFGHPDLLAKIVDGKVPAKVPSANTSEGMARALLERAKIASMQVVPLLMGDQRFGALALGADAEDTQHEGVVAFARAIGAQIVLSLSLIEAFERRALAEESLLRSNEELERRVRERTQELEVSAQRNRDFVAFVSHDLRTPLSAICLGADVLRTGVPTDAPGSPGARTLERIARAAAGMEILVNGLLDTASIEEGSFSLERTDVAVGALAAEVLDLHGPIALAKSIELSVTAPAEGWLSCDRRRVMQVFSNLLGNAVKFTPGGGKISVGFAPQGDVWEVRVTDTGCGIRGEHLPHVFDRYWHSSPNGRQPGTGLGLAIAQGIVEAHGGSIAVESTLGQGSSFRFTVSRGGPFP